HHSKPLHKTDSGSPARMSALTVFSLPGTAKMHLAGRLSASGHGPLRAPRVLSKTLDQRLFSNGRAHLFSDLVENLEVFIRRMVRQRCLRSIEFPGQRHCLAMQCNHLPEPRANVLHCRFRQYKPLLQPFELDLNAFEERPEALAL